MSGRGYGGWVAIAALLSFADGCSCNGGASDPGGAGTTAGGAGMSAVEQDSGAGAGGDGAIDRADGAVEPEQDPACQPTCLDEPSATGRDGGPLELPPRDLRHYAATNGFWMDGRGVAWELDGTGTYLALWGDNPSGNPLPIASGLLHLPWDEEVGDGWYCVGQHSVFTKSTEDPKRSHSSLRSLTRLPECVPGDGALTMTSQGSKLRMTSSSPELDSTEGSPLGARCVGRSCQIYFATLDDDGRFGFLILNMETSIPLDMVGAPLNTATELVSARVAMVRDDGTALVACASGGAMGQGGSPQIQIELTGLSAPLTCPGEAGGAGALDFTTGPPAGSQR